TSLRLFRASRDRSEAIDLYRCRPCQSRVASSARPFPGSSSASTTHQLWNPDRLMGNERLNCSQKSFVCLKLHRPPPPARQGTDWARLDEGNRKHQCGTSVYLSTSNTTQLQLLPQCDSSCVPLKSQQVIFYVEPSLI